jgi:hypothetical protein
VEGGGSILIGAPEAAGSMRSTPLSSGLAPVDGVTQDAPDPHGDSAGVWAPGKSSAQGGEAKLAGARCPVPVAGPQRPDRDRRASLRGGMSAEVVHPPSAAFPYLFLDATTSRRTRAPTW